MKQKYIEFVNEAIEKLEPIVDEVVAMDDKGRPVGSWGCDAVDIFNELTRAKQRLQRK